MKLFTAIGRFFKGQTSGATKKVVQTEAYWNGMEAELDEQVKEVEDNHRRALAVLNVKKEKLATYEKLHKEMNDTAIESREQYKETKDEKYKTNALNAFNKMGEYQVQIDIIKGEIAGVQELYDKLTIVKNSTSDAVKRKKAEITKAKSRVQFSETMDKLTSGIKDIKIMELEGAEDVDVSYHENLSKLDDLSSGVVVPVSSNSDFDAFFNEKTTEDATA